MSFFQKNIHYLRKSKMLSQAQAADAFKVTQNTWSKWEKQREPNYDTLLELSKYFNVDVNSLLERDIEKEGLPTPEAGLPEAERAELNQIIVDLHKKIRSYKLSMDDAFNTFMQIGEFLQTINMDNEEWRLKLEQYNKDLKAGLEEIEKKYSQ